MTTGSNASRTALYGMLTAICLVISYVEARLPVFFPVPGMKLGLTNIVVVAALYAMGAKDAFVINSVRILLSAMLFGSPVSLIYSAAGGIFSTCVMILLKKTDRFGPSAVSACGGAAHGAGQIAAASFLLGTGAVWWYLPALWITGTVSGLFVGLLGGEIAKRSGSWKIRNGRRDEKR